MTTRRLAVVPDAASALAQLTSEADAQVAASKAPATLRAYQHDVFEFAEWCRAHHLESLPADPSTLRVYLVAMARVYRWSTIARRLAAIQHAHELAGMRTPVSDPVVKAQLRGIRRTLGTAPVKKAPLRPQELLAIGERLGDRPKDDRDRAIITLGFAGAFRRSELVALNVEDLELSADGYVVTIRRSKTDQESEGRALAIPYAVGVAVCPVRAVMRWLDVSGITQGALFRPLNRGGRIAGERLSGEAVALVVQQRLRALGIDASSYAGHSLRSGLISAAAAKGAKDRDIAQTSGHKSMTVLYGYMQRANIFRDNAFAATGL